MATAVGDILVCNLNGEFIIHVPDSPGLRVDGGIRIDAMVAYDRGIILSGEQGMIFPFENTPNENLVYRP